MNLVEGIEFSRPLRVKLVPCFQMQRLEDAGGRQMVLATRQSPPAPPKCWTPCPALLKATPGTPPSPPRTVPTAHTISPPLGPFVIISGLGGMINYLFCFLVTNLASLIHPRQHSQITLCRAHPSPPETLPTPPVLPPAGATGAHREPPELPHPGALKTQPETRAVSHA